MAINNSTNAALLAIRIIGSATESTRAQIEAYAAQLEHEVLEKVKTLEEVGWEDYVRDILKK